MVDLRLVRNNKTSALFNTNHLLLGNSVADNFDINTLELPSVLIGNNAFSNQYGVFMGLVQILLKVLCLVIMLV